MTRGVFVASNALTAAELNDVTDPPRCYVYNNANISIATSGTPQALTFNTEVEDTGGMHSTVSNTSRITIPTGGDGWYHIGGSVFFAANATGYRQIYVYLNGTTVLGVQKMFPGSAASSVGLNVNIQYPLAAADYIELYAEQTSGGALNATAAGVYGIAFYAKWGAVA